MVCSEVARHALSASSRPPTSHSSATAASPLSAPSCDASDSSLTPPVVGIQRRPSSLSASSKGTSPASAPAPTVSAARRDSGVSAQGDSTACVFRARRERALQQRVRGQRLCAARGRLRHPHVYPALCRRAAARDIVAVRVDDTPVAKFEQT
eukprot:2968708-Pleurochrysis_carterae.AAC.1